MKICTKYDLFFNSYNYVILENSKYKLIRTSYSSSIDNLLILEY